MMEVLSPDQMIGDTGHSMAYPKARAVGRPTSTGLGKEIAEKQEEVEASDLHDPEVKEWTQGNCFSTNASLAVPIAVANRPRGIMSHPRSCWMNHVRRTCR
jgi:hypothetical protein